MDSIFIRNVTKAYGRKTVLKDFNMEIPCGKITCIMAPSGAGKTTLLRLAMGLEQPDGGSIDGVSGKKLSAVFQEERLCESMTAIENIRLVSPALAIHDVIQELAAAGLGGCEYQPVSELSGGMRRRVSILRALLAEYDILILDEPFQGLDSQRKTQMMAYVKEKTEGKTVIFVTHDVGEAEMMGAEVFNINQREEE